MRRMAVGAVVILCLAAFVIPAAAKRKKPNPAAIALFEKAIQASNLKAKGSVAFRLQATARIFSEQGKQTGGMVVEFWTPGDRWRRETLLPDSERVVVSDGRTRWVKSSQRYESYPVTVLWQMVGFVGELRSEMDHAAGRFPPGWTSKERKNSRIELSKPRKEKGRTGLCVDVRDEAAMGSHHCFDPATGHLLQTWEDHPGLIYQYSDYQSFGKHSFPRAMRIFRANGREMVDVQVTELDALTKILPKMFAPSAGYKKELVEPDCDRTVPSKVINQVLPDQAFPHEPIGWDTSRESGRVVISGVVGADGALHALWVVNSPSPAMSAVTLKALRQWRFRPLTCVENGQKIPVEGDFVFSITNP